MSTFAERFLLAGLATFFCAVVLTNPLGFDRVQKGLIIPAVILLAIFVGYTIERAKPAAPPGQSNAINIGDLNIHHNGGPTQVNIASPGSTQILNPRRVLKRSQREQREVRGHTHVLRVLFDQTEGIWDTGTAFWVQVAFSGPYESAKIISGLPVVLQDVLTTEGHAAAPAAGRYEMHTLSPPLPSVPVVLEVESNTELTVSDLRASPTE